MNFDVRTAKSLEPGRYITFSGYPGLRLSASAKVRTWIYRYKSSIDGRMRQIAIGHWPVLSFPATIVAWESLKNQRNSGSDPVLVNKQVKMAAQALIEKQQAEKGENDYTVRTLCGEYLGNR